MLNPAMIERQALERREVKQLEALHMAMTLLVEVSNRHFEQQGPLPKKHAKALRRHVRHLEYTMQEVWGFPSNKLRHTHWKRFSDLNHLEADKVRNRRGM